MSRASRIMAGLAGLSILALLAVVAIGLAGSSPRSLALFALLVSVPLVAIGWMMIADRKRMKARQNESAPLNAEN